MSETIHTPDNEIHDLLHRHAASHVNGRDNIYGVIDTYDFAGDQSFTGAAITVKIETVRKNDAGPGVFTLAGGQITVNRKMNVELSARIGVGVETGDKFGDVESWLEVDGAEVAGSKMFL